MSFLVAVAWGHEHFSRCLARYPMCVEFDALLNGVKIFGSAGRICPQNGASGSEPLRTPSSTRGYMAHCTACHRVYYTNAGNGEL